MANMAEIRDKIDENFDTNEIIINDDNSDDNMIKRAWTDYINAAIDYLSGAEVMTLSNEELLNCPNGKLWAEAKLYRILIQVKECFQTCEEMLLCYYCMYAHMH